MKKTILSSIAVAALLLSGCSSKEPAVDQKMAEEIAAEQNGGQAQEVMTEDMNTQTEGMGGEFGGVGSKEQQMMQIQSKFQSIHFDFDKYDIRVDQQTVLDEDAEIAKKAQNNFKIKLEGNCDEWGSDEYNFALGLKRAKSVKEGLVAEGVDADKISMVSYGESNPVCTEHTKECWAKNRRVDFKVLP